jgi:hypothetical protein
MIINYASILHSVALQNYPQWGFLVLKNTIWQPWFGGVATMKVQKIFQTIVSVIHFLENCVSNLSDCKWTNK